MAGANGAEYWSPSRLPEPSLLNTPALRAQGSSDFARFELGPEGLGFEESSAKGLGPGAGGGVTGVKAVALPDHSAAIGIGRPLHNSMR